MERDELEKAGWHVEVISVGRGYYSIANAPDGRTWEFSHFLKKEEAIEFAWDQIENCLS